MESSEFKHKELSILNCLNDIEIELNEKYKSYGCEGDTLFTKIFLCMCQQGKIRITTYNCTEYLNYGRTIFKYLHSGSYKANDMRILLGTAIGLANSYEQAVEFLYAANIVLSSTKKQEYGFYNYILKKYCNNPELDIVQKLKMANQEIEEHGYKAIDKED